MAEKDQGLRWIYLFSISYVAVVQARDDLTTVCWNIPYLGWYFSNSRV
jgi:hypothetical protein